MDYITSRGPHQIVNLLDIDRPAAENIWSYQGAEQILEEKSMLDELPAIAQAYVEHGGGNQNLAARRELIEPTGWEQEVGVKFEGRGGASRRASFDAHKDGVLLEHESGEQMRANWHLMKMEATRRDTSGFDEAPEIEAGVLLIPE